MNSSEKIVWQEKFKEQLDAYFLPFWDEKMLDEENNGYYTCIDRDGKIYSKDKSVWFQGRTAYIFSLLYNTYEKRDYFLKISKSAIDFMNQSCFDTDGRMYFTTTEEGKPLRKRRYYYSEAFYVIALSEYYKVTKDETYLEQAKKVFEMIYKIYLDPQNDPFKIYPKQNSNTRSTKTLGPSMILLNVVHILKSIDLKNVTKYDEITDKLIGDIRAFYFPEKKMILENVRTDHVFDVSFPELRHQNPGHALETAWFILNEYELHKNENNLKLALDIIDFSLEAGWDKENEGIKYFTDCLGMPVVQLEADLKLWWPHNEAIIATLYAYKITKNKKYYDWFTKISDYTLKYFPDQKGKEWFGYLTKKNEVNNDYKGSFFKGPFHLPRMLLKVLELLENIDE